MRWQIIVISAILILFTFDDVCAICENNQIDINSASLEELDKLIWVGPATAQKILDSRPYDSVDDLNKVYGIGEVKLQDIKDQGIACVEGEAENREQDVEDEDSEELEQDDREAEDDEEDDISEDDEGDNLNENEDNDKNSLVINNKSNSEKTNKIQIIKLNPPDTKDIKIQENKENLENNNSIYGIGLFFIALIELFTIKYLNKKKNGIV